MLAAPLTRLIPRWRQLDVAGLVICVMFAWLYVVTIYGLFFPRPVDPLTAFGYASLKLITHTLSLFTLSIFIQALLSWFGPGVNNPAASVLWSINEPLLRPVRRLIPPIGGLDLTPLFVIIALQVVNQIVPLPFELRRISAARCRLRPSAGSSRSARG